MKEIKILEDSDSSWLDELSALSSVSSVAKNDKALRRIDVRHADPRPHPASLARLIAPVVKIVVRERSRGYLTAEDAEERRGLTEVATVPLAHG